MARIISYNCNSIRNNSEIVKSLLLNTDILFLQELMLEKRDIGILNDFDNNFRNVAYVNDRECEGICEGRPSKGVAIFWRTCLSPFVSPLIINDYLIGLIVETKDSKVLLLNVYLPCDLQTTDSLEEYKCSLANLEVVIRENNVNQIILAGDFNADPGKGRFWKLLMEFVKILSLQVLTDLFPNDTFTYLCPSRNSTSWLDHIICSKEMKDKILDVSVNYETVLYDHFPLSFFLNVILDVPLVNDKEVLLKEFVNWNKMSVADKILISNFIDEEINNMKILDDEAFFCFDLKCNNPSHKTALNELFLKMKSILLRSTEEFRFINEGKFKVVPGWNEYVKKFHEIARKRFLIWKENGRPRDGKIYDDMKLSRSDFKTALNNCKANDKTIRNRKLLSNLKNKNYKEFWSDVHSTTTHNDPHITDIDGLHNNDLIANMFSNKYRRIFNVSSDGNKFVKCTNISERKRVEILLRFSKEDIKICIKSLRETVGFDKIHSNHLKFHSELLHLFVAKLFTSFVVHNFLPSALIKGVITPIVKNKLGNLSSSDNYRPIMNSSVFLKLFEYCLLAKIEPYVMLNDRQHGFRKAHSTATACYTLKETIFNYTQSRSCVYACFLDISKAFDTVDHSLMIHKLYKLGVPDCLVKIIEYWYNNQFVNVRFKNSFSKEWKIGNGVRQGGVLSGTLFNIYIDSLLNKIASTNIGCKLGIINANIIAYADDIVLLAPSANALRILMNLANTCASELHLSFNYEKTKVMIFRHHRLKYQFNLSNCFHINGMPIEIVPSIKYLGYVITDKLDYAEDFSRVKSKFYADFNVILRHFHFADKDVKVFLFKQYCLQFYGCELWFGLKRPSQELKQFAVGYHKAVKKLLGLSMHESNHFACQEASLLLFNHLVNKIQISALYRFMKTPCNIVHKSNVFLNVSSVFLENVRKILSDEYDILSFYENDIDAIFSRIQYKQNHELQMRETW